MTDPQLASLLTQFDDQIHDAISSALSNFSRNISFSNNASENIVEFLEKFETAAETNGWSAKAKLKKLEGALIGSAKDWFDVNIKDKNLQWKDVKQHMLDHFLPFDYEVFLMQKLKDRKQSAFEPVTSFIDSMLNLIKKAEHPSEELKKIDLIVDGLLPEIREYIITVKPTTLIELEEHAKLKEKALKSVSTSRYCQAVQRFGPVENPEMLALTNKMHDMEIKLKNYEKAIATLHDEKIPRKNEQTEQTSRTVGGKPRCRDCGKVGHIAQRCFARFSRQPLNITQKQCYNCGDIGHFSRNCPKPRNNPQFTGVPTDRRRFFNSQRQYSQFVPFRNASQFYPQQFGRFPTNLQSQQMPNSTNMLFPQQYFMLPVPQTQLSLPPSTQANQATNSNVSLSEVPQNQFPGYLCNAVLVNLLGDETPMTKPVFVNGNNVDCIIDTGSGINIINYTLAEKLKLDIRNYSGPQLFAANNTKIIPFGETSVTVTLFPSGIKREIVVDAMVTRNIPYNFLLGRDGLIKANILIDVTDNELIAKEFHFDDNYFDDYDFPKSTEVKSTISICLKPFETKIIPASCEQEINCSCLLSSASTFLELELVDSVTTDLNLKVTNVTDECVYLSPGTTFALTINLEDCDHVIEDEVRKVNIGANRTESEREEIMNIIKSKRKAFAFKPDEIGRTHISEHQINLIPNVLPIKSPPYRCSPKEKESLSADIEKMIQMGICDESESEWASPVVIILKEDESCPGRVKRRFTTDFRKLNNVTIKDPYPMPLASDIFPCFAGAKVYTRLDLNNGFWQIPLRERDTDYTSFITPLGLFKYKMMAMGLCNAPATFCRTMDKLLRKLKWHGVVVYFDDLVIYSPNLSSHMYLFNVVLDLFIGANLTLRPTKCTFATDSIIMLGFVIDTDGIKPNPKAVEKILKVPFPETLKDLRSFC
ncbi:hypothetical protein B4U80_07539, partial [Leptotrombidium deliense]